DEAVADAEAALAAFPPAFDAGFHPGLRRKLGLAPEQDEDLDLARGQLDAMAENHADYTLTYQRLDEAAAGDAGDDGVRRLFADPLAYDGWAETWRRRLEQEPRDAAERRAAMHAVNPAFIPRNHRVEAVIRAAVDRDDFAPFEELLQVLARPFE